MIRTRLEIVLAERKVANRKPYTVPELADITGLTRQTLYNFANNVTTRYDAPVLDALCKALDVQPGNLLIYVPDEPDK